MRITEKYEDRISGVLSCYDRIVLQGTLPGICYARGMTGYLKANNIRIFDYPKFAEPLRNELRDNAEKIGSENGLEIEFLAKRNIRKEQRIKEIIKERGTHPGLVHIFSAMESCPSYKPWHNKETHHTYLKPAQGKCLHYYFYFIDPLLGLMYVRVPAWCPFRLQIYLNGHDRVASLLQKNAIDVSVMDNALSQTDFQQAQHFSDNFEVELLHRKLDEFADLYCPVIKQFKLRYHWSIMQIEYATDIVFKRQKDLQLIYDHLVRTAVHTVKPDNIATFLGRKLHPNYQDEMGNNFSTRIQGTRIKHKMGPVSVKMYDKFGFILRIETTVNNVSFFKHYRKAEHRDGTTSMKIAPMKKGIYSLSALQKLLFDSNKRYLQFISVIHDVSSGTKKLEKISSTTYEGNRPYKGFNLFSPEDIQIFESIASGEFNITGFQNKNLRSKLSEKSSGQISRILKRLRNHGLIKKIGKTYKYYLTKLGQEVIILGLKLKNLVIIPELA